MRLTKLGLLVFCVAASFGCSGAASPKAGGHGGGASSSGSSGAGGTSGAGSSTTAAAPSAGDAGAGTALVEGGSGDATAPEPPRSLCAPSPVYPEASTFFSSAIVEDTDSLDVPSNGDLWPSCWTGNGMFAAWGDGYGFDTLRNYTRPDIGVAWVTGAPGDAGISGANVATDRGAAQAIFRVWTEGPYYQKPTGMLCRNGKVFLAVQDLNAADYGDAPAATIAVSSDSGKTWDEGTSPMFDKHVFTTVFFVDYGQDAANAPDAFVYAYGLDYNWDSTQALFLARIPTTDDLLNRSAWEFFAGTHSDGTPLWNADIQARQAVLVDCTKRYETPADTGMSVLAQGSVVYNAPLKRYLYTSWSNSTYEFYESPTPWGPFRRFLYKDFGPPPWTATNTGGYGTTIPTKFISSDGKLMWVQSNSWSYGVDQNNLALRRLRVEVP